MEYAFSTIYGYFSCATFHLAYFMEYVYAHAIGNTGSHIRPFTQRFEERYTHEYQRFTDPCRAVQGGRPTDRGRTGRAGAAEDPDPRGTG